MSNKKNEISQKEPVLEEQREREMAAHFLRDSTHTTQIHYPFNSLTDLAAGSITPEVCRNSFPKLRIQAILEIRTVVLFEV